MKRFAPWAVLLVALILAAILLPELRALFGGAGILAILGATRAKVPTHADLSPRAQSDIRAVEADVVAAALKRARDLDAHRGGADSNPH